MGVFDDSSISTKEMQSFKDASLIIQLGIGRQIDRIFKKSGEIYTSNPSFSHSKATMQNMKIQNLFLSKLMLPYTDRKMPEDIREKWKELKDTELNSVNDIGEYSEKLAELFGVITCNLGRFGLLPPVKKIIYSGKD